jgi:hypothetical protein
MKTFRVEALEKFVMRTTYYVQAESAQEAEERCKGGHESYEHKEVDEGDEECLGTVEVEAIEEDDE